LGSGWSSFHSAPSDSLLDLRGRFAAKVKGGKRKGRERRETERNGKKEKEKHSPI